MACHLARALTGAEQATFRVDLDGDGRATRKFFNLSERYEPWRDYHVDPRRRDWRLATQAGHLADARARRPREPCCMTLRIEPSPDPAVRGGQPPPRPPLNTTRKA